MIGEDHVCPGAQAIGNPVEGLAPARDPGFPPGGFGTRDQGAVYRLVQEGGALSILIPGDNGGGRQAGLRSTARSLT
jgi:hypothetical protein